MNHNNVESRHRLVKLLKQHGFIYVERRRRHELWRHADGRQLTISGTLNGPLDRDIVKRITGGK